MPSSLHSEVGTETTLDASVLFGRTPDFRAQVQIHSEKPLPSSRVPAHYGSGHPGYANRGYWAVVEGGGQPGETVS